MASSQYRVAWAVVAACGCGTDDLVESASEVGSGTAVSDSDTSVGSTGDMLPPAICGYRPYVIPGIDSFRLALGDVDGDGALDIIHKQIVGVAPPTGVLQIHFNDGLGTSWTPGPVTDHPSWERMVTGDWNGDGWIDLLHEGLYVQRNEQGVFGLPAQYPLSVEFCTLHVNDYNGDGFDDLAFGGLAGHLALADGLGGFELAQTFSHSGCFVVAITGADFDGNGEIDFAVAGNCGRVIPDPEITIHLQIEGVFSPHEQSPVADGMGVIEPPLFEAGDFDSDGTADIIASVYDIHNDVAGLRVFHGKGDGSFAPPIFEPFHDAFEFEGRVVDLNGDPRDDLIVRVGTTLQVVHSAGPTFDRCTLSDEPQDLRAIGDINGDGRPDALVNFSGPGHPAKVWLSDA